MKEELQIAYKKAFSLRGAADGLIQIGNIQKGEKVFFFYKDKEGDYWYKTKHRTPEGKLISETEHTFGKVPESIKRAERRTKCRRMKRSNT